MTTAIGRVAYKFSLGQTANVSLLPLRTRGMSIPANTGTRCALIERYSGRSNLVGSANRLGRCSRHNLKRKDLHPSRLPTGHSRHRVLHHQHCLPVSSFQTSLKSRLETYHVNSYTQEQARNIRLQVRLAFRHVVGCDDEHSVTPNSTARAYTSRTVMSLLVVQVISSFRCSVANLLCVPLDGGGHRARSSALGLPRPCRLYDR